MTRSRSHHAGNCLIDERVAAASASQLATVVLVLRAAPSAGVAVRSR